MEDVSECPKAAKLLEKIAVDSDAGLKCLYCGADMVVSDTQVGRWVFCQRCEFRTVNESNR